MHDPSVVAWELKLPIPRQWLRAYPGMPAWGVRRRRRTNQENLGEPVYAWWRPQGYEAFAFNRQWAWTNFITIWHEEPDGADSGTICKHHIRWQDEDGEWHSKALRGWRWHVRHWQLQVHALQRLRRTALTRCAWCGGRSRKSDPVNVSHGWDAPRGRWWQGEPRLYHSDCSSMEHAHRTCTCDEPVLEHDGWGQCARCSKFRAWRSSPEPERDAAIRVLATLPQGARITPETRAQVEPLWAATRERDRVKRQKTK